MFPPPFTPTPDLIRVDIPNHPQAIVSSDYGSTLENIPTDVPWRFESIPQVDKFVGQVNPTETFDALNVEEWHRDGIQGQGIKIAVFDSEWYGIDTLPSELDGVQSHDCFLYKSCEPPIDSLQLRYAFERGSHGMACAEVVRDIAPKADLHLVRVNGQTTLENAIDWAIREEVDLISMSLSFFGESFYDGTGQINNLVDKLISADILLVTSAGNYAEQHFLDDHRDNDGDDFHEFPWGSEYLPIYFGTGKASINLSWDEYNNCGRSDFDAFLWNRDGELVGRATRSQDYGDDNCSPSEYVKGTIEEGDWHFLQILRAGGSGQTKLRIFARNGTIYRSMPEGSIVDPGTHPGVYTVGAVRAQNYVFNSVESFSSQGPVLSLSNKPDISGPNGLSTRTFGPMGFYGTSASTPAVTAALAILMSEDPSRTPFEAADILSQSAIWEDTPFQNTQMGAGRARLPHRSTKGCQGFALSLLPLFLFPYRKLRCPKTVRNDTIKTNHFEGK